jgi:hypothetical protein
MDRLVKLNGLTKLNGKYVNTKNIINVKNTNIINMDDYSIDDIKIYPIQKNIQKNIQKKYLRLGYTETTLLFVFWMNNYKKIHDDSLLYFRNKFTRWLYTTSGYYDKTQSGHYMNVIHKSINDPDIYNMYMSTLLNFLIKADILDIRSHIKINDTNNYDTNNYNYYNEFKKYLEPNTEQNISREIVYAFIKNTKLLIISPFAPLMKQQIDNGNCKRIYNDFPNINNVFDYRYPYTFFNDGPHNNILETLENEYTKIIKMYNINNYDSVIISCGAYSNLLAQKFYELNKNVCTVGGELQIFFGIANQRVKGEANNFDWKTYVENYEDLRKANINTYESALQHWNNFGKKEGRTFKKFNNNQYWILNIPDEYKPENYMSIEKGCYW